MDIKLLMLNFFFTDSAPSLPTGEIKISEYNFYHITHASDVGFVETPDSLIAVIGERAIFNCQHCTAVDVDWELNGTIIPSSNLPESIDIDYIFSDN